MGGGAAAGVWRGGGIAADGDRISSNVVGGATAGSTRAGVSTGIYPAVDGTSDFGDQLFAAESRRQETREAAPSGFPARRIASLAGAFGALERAGYVTPKRQMAERCATRGLRRFWWQAN